MSQHNHLYKLKAWLMRRAAQLAAEPLCAFCLQEGRETLGTVADHIKPHRGDLRLFLYGELQTLCAPCHSSTKQRIEARGHDDRVGVDGWPVDTEHPINKEGV